MQKTSLSATLNRLVSDLVTAILSVAGVEAQERLAREQAASKDSRRSSSTKKASSKLAKRREEKATAVKKKGGNKGQKRRSSRGKAAPTKLVHRASDGHHESAFKAEDAIIDPEAVLSALSSPTMEPSSSVGKTGGPVRGAPVRRKVSKSQTVSMTQPKETEKEKEPVAPTLKPGEVTVSSSGGALVIKRSRQVG
jgi:hypothetical protein